MTTVQDIYEYLDTLAPFETQDNTDNCGLLVGNRNAIVKSVLVCLDVTNDVIAEAVEKNADLIIAHHPLMYRPVKKIMHTDPLHALIANNINFIAIHTNLDIAAGGDLMLERLGFPKSDEAIDVYGKITDLDKPISSLELAQKCCEAFNTEAVRYIEGAGAIKRLAVCTGSGCGLTATVIEKGCEAYICGDVRHEHMVLASNYGLTLIDAGHFHTENIFCDYLTEKLEEKFIEFKGEINVVRRCVFTYCKN
jgi:dinuclear metal center YbgI/SA1388 family protein